MANIVKYSNGMDGKNRRFLMKISALFRNKKAFLKIALPILGGIIIGLFTTFILKFIS
jgi:hypothetical protein